MGPHNDTQWPSPDTALSLSASQPSLPGPPAPLSGGLGKARPRPCGASAAAHHPAMSPGFAHGWPQAGWSAAACVLRHGPSGQHLRGTAHLGWVGTGDRGTQIQQRPRMETLSDMAPCPRGSCIPTRGRCGFPAPDPSSYKVTRVSPPSPPRDAQLSVSTPNSLLLPKQCCLF